MMSKKIILYQENEIYGFLNQLLQYCYINESNGKLYCKKCHNLVHVNWHKYLGYCGTHIISRLGVKNNDENTTIYIKPS